MIRKAFSEYQVRDDAYIEAFCEYPQSGKQSALIKAGYEGGYAAQEAYRIHKRLQNRIDDRLDEMINEGANLGYSVLKSLATGAQSESVQAKCAIALMDYAGRKIGDTLTIKKDELTPQERSKAIKVLQDKLNITPA